MRETSLRAYYEIREEGLLSPTRFRVYEHLIERGPRTAAEVDCAFDSQHMHKRLSELERQGVIHTPRTRRCEITGRDALEWAVIPDTLPSGVPPVSVPKIPSPEQARHLLLDLREMQACAKAHGFAYTHAQDMTALAEWLHHRASKTSHV